MHTKPLIFLGSFIASWIAASIFTLVTDDTTHGEPLFTRLLVTPLFAIPFALLITLPLALSVLLIKYSVQSFKEKPTLTIIRLLLLVTIIIMIGLQLPYLHVMVGIAVFLTLSYKI